MAVERSVYQAHRNEVRTAVLAAATVIPPEGTGPEALARWSEELAAAAGAITQAVETAASVLKESTFTGRLESVANPVRPSDGSALNLAQVSIHGDIGDPEKPDRTWIDLRAESGAALARVAEALAGSRVAYTVRQVVEMTGGRPVPDGDGYTTRTRLAAISAVPTGATGRDRGSG